ncbi:MAG: glycosyl transferase, partial [Hyphomicrobiales bacterium]|nr:glycosyl transferase [Hyphomicrobiales bacterium]
MKLQSHPLPGGRIGHRSRLDVAVAIPVRDEEERIAACLEALARAARHAHEKVHVRSVTLLLNNCTDASGTVVEDLRAQLPFPIHVIDVALPPERAHAGAARRMVADHAARSLDATGQAGVILVTDADSCVSRDWLSTHAAAFAQGADAVAGVVRINPSDLAHWPADLRRRELAEARYSALLSQIAHVVDPDPLDPWPRHDQASGANLGVTLAAYRRSGGIPEIALGEDRAFV